MTATIAQKYKKKIQTKVSHRNTPNSTHQQVGGRTIVVQTTTHGRHHGCLYLSIVQLTVRQQIKMYPFGAMPRFLQRFGSTERKKQRKTKNVQHENIAHTNSLSPPPPPPRTL